MVTCVLPVDWWFIQANQMEAHTNNGKARSQTVSEQSCNAASLIVIVAARV
jgi:hypothetical protein